MPRWVAICLWFLIVAAPALAYQTFDEALKDGQIRLAKGKAAEALASFKEADALCDNQVQKAVACIGQGDAMVLLKKYHDALNFYQRAEGYTPNDADVRSRAVLCQAECHLTMKNPALAAEAARKVQADGKAPADAKKQAAELLKKAAAAPAVPAASAAASAKPAAAKTPSAPKLPVGKLPTDEDYQRTLRAYLATLKAEHFELEVKPFTVPPTPVNDAQCYRFSLLGFDPTIRLEGIAAPAAEFTLAEIEEAGVQVPPIYPATLAWLAVWDFEGNPYKGSKAVKLRAFVGAAVDMMMTDQLHAKNQAKRSDYLGGTLIWLAYTYLKTKDVLPKEVQTAYEAGLRRMALKLKEWGPTGMMTDMDLFSSIGLAFTCEALPNDAELKAMSAEYVKRLYTDPHLFFPTGFFIDHGGYDVTYNGISLYMTTWVSLVGPWTWPRDALKAGYDMRRYLILPDPDGNRYGPSHWSPRTSSDAFNDQWNWPHRQLGAAMITDAALYSVPLDKGFPPDNSTKTSIATLVKNLNILQSRRTPPAPWKENHWIRFPNFAFDRFDEKLYDRILKLKQDGSPLLKLPWEQPEDFAREFDRTVWAAKKGKCGVIVHVGETGWPNRSGQTTYGFSGGALSAFWTPETGSVVLGRRRGSQGETADSFKEWRSWPCHAISGVTPKGGVFSTSLMRKPEYTCRPDGVDISAAMTAESCYYMKNVLVGEVKYARKFTLDAAALRVEESVEGDGKDSFGELAAIIPVFLKEIRFQKRVPATAIQFQVGGAWIDAPGTEPLEPGQDPKPLGFTPNVTAVRLKRFSGAVVIRFDAPQRVKLSPSDWVDGYQSMASCRNILVDLLGAERTGKPLGRVTFNWSIAPEPGAAKEASRD